MASQVALVVKNPPASAGDPRDLGSIPGSGRSPGGGHGNPLQYSCLENPMARGAWWAVVGCGPLDPKEPNMTEASWHTHGFSGNHGDVGVGPRRRLSAKESMLSNCGAEEDYSESLGWHEDQACQF